MLFHHEVHHCSLFLYSFDICLFYGAPVARVSVIFIRVGVYKEIAGL
jgi:hypothetical protein